MEFVSLPSHFVLQGARQEARGLKGTLMELTEATEGGSVAVA